MSTTFLWAIVAVIVAIAVAVAITIVRAVAARKASQEAALAVIQSLRAVPQSCRAGGHAYREHDTGWRCATCGHFVPRRDGELYGSVEDGRHERRRHPR
jgi:hypothetical protein